MWVFYIMLLVPIVIQHCVWGKRYVDHQKKNQRALAFFFIVVTLLIGLRHESVGSDTGNYIYYFENYLKSSWDDLWKTSLELGYSYFNKIISVFTTDSQIFLFVSAAVISLLIYPTYKRLCVDPTLTIVLYVSMATFVFSFSGIRQMLAIGIGFLAYEFTRRKKLFLFILSVVLAIIFHASAFMLVFMYPLYHVKITKKWLLAVVPVLGTIFVFNKQIFSMLAFLLEMYTDYDASMTSTGAFTMLILFTIFAVFSFLIPNDQMLDRETIGLRNFLLLAVVLQMFAPLHMIAMRMNYYYIIFIPVLLPKIIQARSERWKEIAVAGRHVMVVFFLVYFFFSAYTSTNNLRVFPYHFFWESI